MAVERIFLGWDRPALEQAARWLIDRFTTSAGLDLGSVIVAVPGRRAGRRLIEILAQSAAGQALVPPRYVTSSELPQTLCDLGLAAGQQHEATELEALLLRAQVMQQAPAEIAAPLWPHPPDRNDLPGWLELARELQQLDDLLASHNLDLASACDRCTQVEYFEDEDRWAALVQLDTLYKDALAEAGWTDANSLVAQAMARRQLRQPSHLVLLACAELTPRLRSLLLQCDSPVTALIFAPESERACFDELGGFQIDPWQHRPLAFDQPNLRVRMVENPREQNYILLRQLATFDRIEPDQITLGLGDEQEAPAIARTLELAGIPSRIAAGQTWGTSRPARLLKAISTYLNWHRLGDLAALIRHPDIETWLDRQHLSRQRIDQLDCYAADHLVRAVEPEQWPGSSSETQPIHAIHTAIEALLPPQPERAQPLPFWSDAIRSLLEQVYLAASVDGTLNQHDADEQPLIRALTQVGSMCAELASLASLPGFTPPRVNLAQAIDLVLNWLQDQPIPAESGQGAVELLGWLELLLDDAPTLIVTSINEGHIPSAPAFDVYVPQAICALLQLPDDRYRYARDMMIMTTLVRSRSSITLLATRRDSENNPRTPSRLLLACDPDTLIQRIERFYSPVAISQSEPHPILHYLEPGPASQFTIPFPQLLNQPLRSLRVTAFRDYLACRYRFYLRHVLKLDGRDPLPREMGGDIFGSLAHQVLQNFGCSDLSASTDAVRIAAFLSDELDRVTQLRLGRQPATALQIQREQLRARLEAFAHWQAKQVRQGWRIWQRGVESELQASIEVDGEPFTVTGRIDRVDEHPDLGYRILDYKTSDTKAEPDKIHRKGVGGKRHWVDLQLPLYRELARSAGVDGQVQLGYVALPKNLSQLDLYPAPWDESMLAAALDQARAVIRDVRQQRFWKPGPPPTYSDHYAGICLDECRDRIELAESAP